MDVHVVLLFQSFGNLCNEFAIKIHDAILEFCTISYIYISNLQVDSYLKAHMKDVQMITITSNV